MGITKLIQNANKPAPRWYRKFKKIFSNIENFVLTLLMIQGTAADAPILLVIKLCTSFILNNLDTLMANGEDYIRVDNEGDQIKKETDSEKEVEDIKP